MSRLTWGAPGETHYITGIDRGVFYPLNSVGQPWDGLIKVEELTGDYEARPRYLDGQRIGAARHQGAFAGRIEAFTYPMVFTNGMVTPQRKSHFSMSYRVAYEGGYRIHLIYNALALPEEHNYKYQPQGDDLEPFSWTITTRGMAVPGATAVSHLIIDTQDAYSWTVAALEDLIYGSDVNDPHMPTPLEVYELFEENSFLRIIDHGDGTWTAIGSDAIVNLINPTTFQIDWPTAIYVNPTTYTVSSL